MEVRGDSSDSTSTIRRLQEPMKLFKLIKMCLNETYNKVLIGKYLIVFLSKTLNKEMLPYRSFSIVLKNMPLGTPRSTRWD
jgi:hypothetical protein